MYIGFFGVDGWRNYRKTELTFSPGINFLYGNNGQGKTNLLEAIYFLCTGQAPRAAKLDELINWQYKYFFIRGQLNANEVLHTIESGYARDGRRIHRVDGINMDKISQLGEVVTAVFFTPQDISLVRDGPLVRRRFLDVELSQLSKQYKLTLASYTGVLRERNALLRSRDGNRILLDVLTERLIHYYRPIVTKRQEFLDHLSILARLGHRKISDSKENLDIIYKPSINEKMTNDQVLEAFAQVRGNELHHKTTLIGPHRDDFQVLINGAELRVYGSQGQQRTAVLAMKLAEVELFRALSGTYPLVLLDDVFSELDSIRKELLLEQVETKPQTFITSAEPLDNKAVSRTFFISQGTIAAKDDV